MPQREQLPAGTDVIITITATADSSQGFGREQWFVTEGDHEHLVDLRDPHVSIVVVEPERPTIEALLEQHIEDYDNDCDLHAGCTCAELKVGNDSREAARMYRAHVAAVLREAGVAR